MRRAGVIKRAEVMRRAMFMKRATVCMLPPNICTRGFPVCLARKSLEKT